VTQSIYFGYVSSAVMNHPMKKLGELFSSNYEDELVTAYLIFGRQDRVRGIPATIRVSRAASLLDTWKHSLGKTVLYSVHLIL